jgi:hypothetical protein
LHCRLGTICFGGSPLPLKLETRGHPKKACTLTKVTCIPGIVVLKIHAEQGPNLEAGMSNHGPKKSATFPCIHTTSTLYSAIVCGGRAPCPSALHPINELSPFHTFITRQRICNLLPITSRKNLFNSINYNIGRSKVSIPQLKKPP